jgi:hypothetical protein
MSFKADFWVVIGTAAPVIALSCIVLIIDQFTLRQDIAEAKLCENRYRDQLPNPSFMANLAYIVNASTAAIQAGMLSVALSSLAAEKSEMPVTLAIIAETGSLAALVFTVCLMALGKNQVRRLNYMATLSEKP